MSKKKNIYIYIYSFPDFFDYWLLQYIEWSSLCYTVDTYILKIDFINKM